jgi:biopolymer transport protein ExbB
MMDLILKGGPVMIPIVLLSIVALAIILERLWRLWKARLNVSQFAQEVFLFVERGHLQRALERCKKVHHPLAVLFQLGILNRTLKREELEKLMEREGEEQIRDLERYLGGLIVIIGVEPMLGFLGTITGLIRAFMTWERLGSNITVNVLAAGIYEAMITTAAGLIVAIPYYIVYHFMIGKIKGCAQDMSYYGNELLDVLARVREVGMKEVATR